MYQAIFVDFMNKGFSIYFLLINIYLFERQQSPYRSPKWLDGTLLFL